MIPAAGQNIFCFDGRLIQFGTITSYSLRMNDNILEHVFGDLIGFSAMDVVGEREGERMY